MSPVSGHGPRQRPPGRTLRRTYLPIVVVVIIVMIALAWLALGGGF